jgi:transcriptional regulator with XRE-family HTH domain
MTDSLVDPEALRAARRRAGLTQHQLAREVGVAGGERVSLWERGLNEPKPEVLHRVAATLGVPVGTLMAGSSSPVTLRRLRVRAGMSARELAAESRVSVGTVVRWESGRFKRLPAPSVLTLAAAALQVSVAELESALGQSREARARRPQA